MLILPFLVAPGTSYKQAQDEAQVLANRFGFPVLYEFGGQHYTRSPSPPIDAEFSDTNRPKFRIGCDDGLYVDRQMPGVTAWYDGDGHHLCGGATEVACKMIAEALGGEFIGRDVFTEVF